MEFASKSPDNSAERGQPCTAVSAYGILEICGQGCLIWSRFFFKSLKGLSVNLVVIGSVVNSCISRRHVHALQGIVSSEWTGGGFWRQKNCVYVKTRLFFFTSQRSSNALSALLSQQAIERVGRLINQRFGIVRIGVEIFEGEITTVAGLVERLHHGGPVGGSIQQRAK